MKRIVLASLSLAVALAVSACGAASPAAPAATQPTTEVATAAPATATAMPATPTTAPTAVPTVAPTSTSIPVPTVAPTNTASAQAASSALGSDVTAFRPMAIAMAAAKSYRMTITSSVAASGAGSHLVLEVVKPDRLHTTVDAGGGKTFETIIIGTTTYLKAGATWTKSPVANPGTTSSILSSDPQKLLDQMGSNPKTGSLTKGGTNQVDGTTCQEWVWTPAPSGATQTGGTMCIGQSNNLPLQFKTSDGKTVVKYSDWNAPISIEAPI